ncbi:hypothetical protein [Piscinibacter gummiphilus]|uniref:Uncharacterized protein n=1 Tax=Piscinibacter gummiphilus TaxID=946333 RepID=A0A1W6LH91_9BURK|nr:hypothetical protein [Piscinibacter gummiphilus]ARN23583.1 hypothetical protein A4W93_28845 [Piscinibacter gummiphilus]ATU68291.1 hypothetical protein CPZ87_28980 [Piscinibacter gummiphilus]GLS98180.1 hypothetical protein GCM10007918_54720 [Piscinibacter gummiphilus]
MPFPRNLTVAGCLLALSASALAQGTQLAYGGRVVPPMTGPQLPDLGGDPAPPAPRPQWDHALPFFAQKVIDRGIDLPNPYDIGASLYLGREERVLSSLAVGFNGGPKTNADFVSFPRADIKTQSFQLQAGAWVFPFLNLYAIGGYTQGTGEIDIEMSGKGLMEYLGVPGCNLAPALQPELCSRTLKGTAHAKYHGKSYGAGATVAGAHRNLFFALPITYVISDLTMSDTNAKTWNIAPRIGYNQHLGEGGMLTWYVGGTYLKSDINITGTADFDTAGTPLAPVTSMSYSIHVEPKHRWNALVGANWTLNKMWSVMAEVGFAGAREDLLFTAFYRF